MSDRNDGGPAFPETRWDDHTRQEIQWMGMSLRDYFAAKAMEGLLAQSLGTAFSSQLDSGASFAYEMADAMLKERNK